MPGITGGSISIIGIVFYIGSLILFHRHVIKTPTTYLLQWLARVDIILLVLYFFYVTLFYVMRYLHIGHDNLYRRVIWPCHIWPYVQVYVWPVFSTAATCTNWLTVFIGLHQYLAICKPVSNSYRHVGQHRRKYVLIVLSMALLCNIPYFFVRNLSPFQYNKVYFYYVDTSLGNNDAFN